MLGVTKTTNPFKDELESALTLIHSYVHHNHKKHAGVKLSTGHVISASIVRRRMGFFSIWWGMSAPDGRTLLGGLDKATCRTKAAKILKEAA